MNPCRPRSASVLLALLLLLPAWCHASGEVLAIEPPTAASADPPLVEPGGVVHSHDLDWFDPTRQRAVPVRLYLPAGARQGHPVPLVVFSHGIGGSRRGYSYLGQFWASHGFASLHLQHVGSDRAVWTGNPLAVVGRLQAAAQEGEASARAMDLRFALDQLLSGELAPLIDARRIVAAGHSYGANTTLLVAGARVERAGQVLALRDARIKAAIVISAPPFYGERAIDRVLGGIDLPTLHITTTEDVIRVPGYFSPASDRVAVFDATGGRDKTLVVFEGGSHSIFTDRAGTGGMALNPQVKRATQALSLAFLRRVFEGDASAWRQWPMRYGGLLTRYTPAGE
ncbi:MAG: acetylhydrolase [Burkholderiales bacterium]|nr:acetylhydrolase [Burkholderiales bacterium]